jgi:LuxR family transcriptional activator of conjugal transfer of Ti plasmids
MVRQLILGYPVDYSGETMVAIACCALEDCCDSLQTAKTVNEFRCVASAAARQLGFQWYAYLSVCESTLDMLSSYPTLFQRRYVELRLCDEDPIIRHARNTNTPFSWGDAEEADLYFNSNNRVVREAMKCGIRTGITIPIHPGYNNFAALSFAGRDRAPLDLVQDPGTLQLIGLQFHVRYSSKTENSESLTDRILTQRQQECLKWSARGKTMSEIATILRISERTVLFHLQEARQRLDAQTITHAVATAIRLKEIPEL